MATTGSARAMGFAGLIGDIAPRYKADIVLPTSATSITCLATISSARLSLPKTVAPLTAS